MNANLFIFQDIFLYDVNEQNDKNCSWKIAASIFFPCGLLLMLFMIEMIISWTEIYLMHFYAF